MRSPVLTVLDHKSMKLLLLGLLLIIAPHLTELPWWVSVLAIGGGIWRWRASVVGWRLPIPTVRILFTFFVIALIFLQFGNTVGRDAGIALLVAMMALKLFELKARRDILVLVFISYFMLGTHFLYSQTIPMVIYVFIATWVFMGLHIHLSFMDSQPIKNSLRTSGYILAQALPLMLILFVVFPRLPGPIWNLPQDSYEGMTGLDDSMSPGNISNLSQSDEIAFRVKFDSEIPPPNQRYWRGPVFSNTDGRNWTPAPEHERILQESMLFHTKRNPVSYTVTLEAHNRNWLFALDLPAHSTQHGNIRADYQLVSARPVRQRLRYKMISFMDYTTPKLSSHEREIALDLPPGRNPQTIELGKLFRQNADSDMDIVNQALRRFREQEYIYTLRPPLLKGNSPSDEFLFNTQRGFCEHYASSFVVLMRAAGIPARVVTGYQGGEVNTVGDYLTVRQRDAHAWAEIWLENTGWTRFDPTAAVAPQRVEMGIDTSSSSLIGDAIRFDIGRDNVLAKFISRVQQQIDSIDNTWNQFVLGYGPEQQSEFLRNLGINIRSLTQLAWTLGLTLISVFLITAFLVLRKRQPDTDPVQKQFLRFCKKMEKSGFVRSESETAHDFAKRILMSRPELKESVQSISVLYSQLRYGKGHYNPSQLKEFKHRVTSFKP